MIRDFPRPLLLIPDEGTLLETSKSCLSPKAVSRSFDIFAAHNNIARILKAHSNSHPMTGGSV